ncbi:MAG: DNA polymerase III subunit delta [Patescibacteria group bacterium]
MIFFFYGQNSWLAKAKIDAIVNKFRNEIDPAGHNIDRLDGETIKADDFFQAISVTGFLASKKLIVVKNILANKKITSWQDSLLQFLKKQKDSREENYIIFWETEKPDARGKLYKTLKQFKYVEEFKELSNNELSVWVKKQADKNNKKISPGTIKLFLAYTGNDLWAINQELNKLFSYCLEEITDQDIKKLTPAKIDENVFNLVDALSNRNKALAMKLVGDQLQAGANGQYLLSMIVRQYRLLIKTKLLAKQISYPGALAQALKIQPWLAEKTLRQSQGYTLEQLKNIYHQLLELDAKLKSTALDEQLLFTKMIEQL